MFSNFGSINDMTKSQFQKAIEYYQNKIKTMTEDKNISDDAKHWFLNQYNERLKSLQNALEDLDLAINRARSSSAFIDESRATLTTMGTSSSSYNNFDNLAQNERRYIVSQRWKVVGAILLPLVGTIPFIRSWRAAKRKHDAIESRINRENIELGNFVSKEKRPYEATLLTSTKFTEEEMANLLEDPAELSRLSNLATATPSTISPIQRKNLTTKLAEVREFGQKNGYDVHAILTDPAFETSVDKTQTKINTHQATFSSIPSSATTLKQAYDAIKQLEELRTKVQELYNSSKDKRLETLLSDIDSKIATLKTHAKTKINAGVNEIVAAINDVKENNSGSSLSANELNTNINMVNNASSTHFGTDVTAEQAKRMAEELGFTSETDEHKRFDEIDSARTSKIEKLNTELAKVKGEDELRQNIADNLDKLEKVLTDKLDKLSSIDEINIKEAFIYRAEAESAYNYLSQNITILTPTEKSDFDSLREKYLTHESTLNKKNQEFASKAENFDAYKTEIDTAIDRTKDKDTLSGELEMLKSTLETIESAEYKEKMNKIGLGSELNRLISTAKTKITKYESLITQKEVEEENTKHNEEVKDILDENEAILNPILSSISTGTLSTNLIELANYEQQINNVITALSTITGTLDPANKTKLRTLSQSANKSSVAVKSQIEAVKEPKALEDYYKTEIEKVEEDATAWIAKLDSTKTKAQALEHLGILLAKLKRLKNEASKKTISLDFDSLITTIDQTIKNNSLGLTTS